jgi:hypothetical protein
VRRGEGEDEGGAARRRRLGKKKKKKKKNGRARGDSGSSRGIDRIRVSTSAPLALQCCRTNDRRIARTNPPDARVLRARPRRARSVGPPRGDRRGVASARGRAGGSARASIAAHAPSRRGDKRARGRGGAIGAGPSSCRDWTRRRRGGAVGGGGRGGSGGGGGGGGGPAAGNRTVAARTSARPPRSALPGPRFPPSARSSGRVRKLGASASVPNATTRFQRRDQWRRTNIARRSRSEPITERLKPPIAV